MLDVLRGDLEETDRGVPSKRRGWPKKRSGSYVGVYEEPEVLLAPKRFAR